MPKPKLAIIGASHFQLPLIERARQKGCEVHAFAWRCGDVGESAADVFHPVSITEVDRIVDECSVVGVQGICTIASDLATVAVSHVADALGLTGNTIECMRTSTDKSLMREAFAKGGDPSPRHLHVSLRGGNATAQPGLILDEDELASFDPTAHGLGFPLIVKPTDRSGSRGVTKLERDASPEEIAGAFREAFEQGFSKQAIVEEFAEGDEFSVEGMSWEGEHRILAITRKATTGAPHFIETAHLQPALLSPETVRRVESVTKHALDTLGVRFGASHSELKIASDGTIKIIEIGARMGGDCIGSHMVELSTGIDYVGAVVDVALGKKPDLTPAHAPAAAASRFLFDEGDFELLRSVQHDHPELVRYTYMMPPEEGQGHVVSDSSTRLGHFVMSAPDVRDLLPYLPEQIVSVAKGAGA